MQTIVRPQPDAATSVVLHGIRGALRPVYRHNLSTSGIISAQSNVLNKNPDPIPNLTKRTNMIAEGPARIGHDRHLHSKRILLPLHEKSPADRGDQQVATRIRLDSIGTYGQSARFLGVIWTDQQRMERCPDRIISHNPLTCPYPQVVEPVFMERVYVIVREGKWIIEAIPKNTKLPSIISVQPVISAQPDEPLAILYDTPNRII